MLKLSMQLSLSDGSWAYRSECWQKLGHLIYQGGTNYSFLLMLDSTCLWIKVLEKLAPPNVAFMCAYNV